MQRADRNSDRFVMTETVTLAGTESAAFVGDLTCPQRYQHQGTIGNGGMGAVVHAYDMILHRHVALKLPRADAKNAAARGEDLWREAQLTAQLEHPGVPAIYELMHAPDGAPQGFAMQLVRGKTLLEQIDELGEERLSPARLPQLVEVLSTVSEVVTHAHRHLMLHLDIKAENIMLEPSGRCFLIDWGVAARCGRRWDGGLMPLDIQRGARGTITYMAPEQFESSLGHVDERTDVHGLGGVLCHILTGKAPFHARTPSALKAEREQPVAALEQPLAGGERAACLARIALRALSARPAQRYASATAFRAALAATRSAATGGSGRSAATGCGDSSAATGCSGAREEAVPMASEAKAQAILSSIWLFADLGPRELERLASVASRRRYAPGATVVQQGDTDGDLYVVIDGLLRVSVRPNDQRELALNLLRSGDVFGELSLVDGLGRSATISAVHASELLVIRRAEFNEVLTRSPDLAVRLLKTMAGLVRRLTERVEDLSVRSVSARLAKKLLEIADLCGTKLDQASVALPLTLSQQDLAEHIQATRESVNKCLAKWTRDDIVYRTQSQIVIKDRARLRQLVDETDPPALGEAGPV